MKACVSGRQHRLNLKSKCEWCGATAEELVNSEINVLKEPRCFVYHVEYDKPLAVARQEIILGNLRWPCCAEHKCPLELEKWSDTSARLFCPEWQKGRGY